MLVAFQLGPQGSGRKPEVSGSNHSALALGDGVRRRVGQPRRLEGPDVGARQGRA